MFTQEQKKYVSGLLIAALALLIVFLAALSLNAFKETKYIGTGGDVPNTLTFSGEAEIRIEPDIARVNFGVEEEDLDVSNAQNVVSAKISNILDELDSMGIREKDIRTISYTTNPRYDWNDGSRELRGYMVSQRIEVIVRDIEDVDEVIGMLGGNDVTNLSGPYFEVENEENYERLARQQAIQAAKQKAEELADDLGVKLIRVVSFNEGGGYDAYPRANFASALSVEEADVEIPIGENIITSNITITYEIQ